MVSPRGVGAEAIWNTKLEINKKKNLVMRQSPWLGVEPSFRAFEILVEILYLFLFLNQVNLSQVGSYLPIEYLQENCSSFNSKKPMRMTTARG